MILDDDHAPEVYHTVHRYELNKTVITRRISVVLFLCGPATHTWSALTNHLGRLQRSSFSLPMLYLSWGDFPN